MKKIIYVLIISMLLNFALITSYTSFANTTSTSPFKDLDSVNMARDISYMSTNFYYTEQSLKNLYKEAIGECYNEGILSGTGKTTFSPSLPVTRAMALTVVCRRYYKYINKDIENVSLPFNDVPSNSYYIDYLKMAYASGMVKGVSSNKFSPDSYADEETIIVFISRLIIQYPEVFVVDDYRDQLTSFDSQDDFINHMLHDVRTNDTIHEWAKEDFNNIITLFERRKYFDFMSDFCNCYTSKFSIRNYMTRVELAMFLTGKTWDGVIGW